jgi:hypothetical protein
VADNPEVRLRVNGVRRHGGRGPEGEGVGLGAACGEGPQQGSVSRAAHGEGGGCAVEDRAVVCGSNDKLQLWLSDHAQREFIELGLNAAVGIVGEQQPDLVPRRRLPPRKVEWQVVDKAKNAAARSAVDGVGASSLGLKSAASTFVGRGNDVPPEGAPAL